VHDHVQLARGGVRLDPGRSRLDPGRARLARGRAEQGSPTLCAGALGLMDNIAVLALLVGAALIAIIVPYVFRAPGRALRKRFVALGSLKGRTRRDIEKAVGPASQETPLPDGRTLLQWRATGYHIALVFEKDGRCFGVTHENGRRVRASRSPDQ
jgi:hypothetical protein